MTGNGKRCQLQSGDPTFRTRVQSSHIGCGQFATHGAAEELGGFGRRELQVGLADLHDLSARSQPRQGQRGVFAAGDDEVELRRPMFE